MAGRISMKLTLPARQTESNLQKVRGVYYTPVPIVDYLVEHTIAALLSCPACKCTDLRILDPACGSGLMLLGTYQFLLGWHLDLYLQEGPEKHRNKLVPSGEGWRLGAAERQRILLECVHGVDIDPEAVMATKSALLSKMLETESSESMPHRVLSRADLSSNIQCGNALIEPDFCPSGFDWNAAFPRILGSGGFDVVIGNPPWGQKAIECDSQIKRYLRRRFLSTRGIFDIFRPFVELGIGLLRPGGMFGFVLPDIVLLKNYSETRRYLLEQLTLHRIDWWGRAFTSAVIDAATIVGKKEPAPSDHCVQVCVRDPHEPLEHEIRQGDFWSNPRLTFNLHLTAEKRRLLRKLEDNPKLGSYFEVHEGVHSGNIRKQLFVNRRIDETCRELYCGRREIVPYHLRWNGRFLRLGVVPKTRTPQRYANIGKAEWHAREKVLVRRTGDHVLAAVDSAKRYASNNFFVAFARQPCSLDPFGLCGLLNSRLMTWIYRTVEPRRGRVFAELKIKHLVEFPLPDAILDPHGCQRLNYLSRVASSNELNTRIRDIDRLAYGLYGLTEAEIGLVEASGGC
jgi:hypothetical protein